MHCFFICPLLCLVLALKILQNRRLSLWHTILVYHLGLPFCSSIARLKWPQVSPRGWRTRVSVVPPTINAVLELRRHVSGNGYARIRQR